MAQLDIVFEQNLVVMSSIVNEVIKAISNLFIFFYEKTLHTQKPQNA